MLERNSDFIGIFIDIDDDELVNRLLTRGHDDNFINNRMKLANEQRSKADIFDYIVNNVDINTTVKNILDIICTLEEA